MFSPLYSAYVQLNKSIMLKYYIILLWLIDMTSKEFEEIRVRHGLSCDAMADILGVTTQSIYNWRHGRAKIGEMTARFVTIIDRNPDLIRQLKQF